MITKDDFINSDFYEKLQALKNAIEENKDVEISNKEELRALARLKKVVKYIDTYISLVDYDLLTTNEMQELNNISDNINTCRDYLSSSQIHEANNYIDACLPTIKNIFPRLILPRESIKNVFAEYSETIQHNIDKIDFDTALKASQQIQEIEQEQRIEKINAFFNKIYSGDDDSNYVPLEKQKNDIYNEITELEDKIKESSNKQDDLDKYYIRIFGELDTETNEMKGGLKHEIDTRKRALDEYKITQEQVIEALKEDIKSKMPNATSVGLATAFSKEKKNFQGDIKKWNLGFVFSILGLLLFAVWKIYSSNADLRTLQDTLIFILSGLPIVAPLVWLTYYCAKRRSEHAMLLQEYTHKETFANSYSSYKQQIEALQDKEELSNELLKKAITIIARNPTHVLNKKHSGDLPADEIKKIVAALTALLPTKQKTKDSE